jgi:acyl dehydratase
MTIARHHIGFTLPSFTVLVDPDRLLQFSRAIGETSPQLCGTIAPPTFLKALEGEHNSSRVMLEALEVNLRDIVHAEQQFDYLAPVRAGDSIQVERRVRDIYDKRDGAIEFIVLESVLSREGTVVARSRQLIMVRNRGARVAA